jgi:phosphatidylglycerophosphatase A
MPNPHKNKSRAPLLPLNAPTLALSSLGLGFLRPAPGSWGSLPPVALCALLILSNQHSLITPALIILLVISCILCIAFGRYAESRFSRKDAAEVVIDETAGQSLTLLPLCIPALTPASTTAWLIALAAAFLLFRIFDTLKPPPARRLESLPHGWGVLADDLMAGVYAALTLTLGLWLFA